MKAQTYVYHPFPTNSGCWSYQYYDDFHVATGMYDGYSLFGDTTIAGSNYKKMVGYQTLTGYQSGAIRDSNKVIYYRPDTYSSEFILYNFNLNLGDTIIHPYGGAGCSNDTVIIQQVDSILLSEGYHKQFYLSSFANWIEGVGSISYLPQPCNVLCASGNDLFECLHKDSAGVYEYGNCFACMPVGVSELNNINDITISPNPITSQTTITFSETQMNTTIKITDLLGKVIRTLMFTGRQLVIDKAEMKPGIYFVQTTDEQKQITNKIIIIQ
ncbi:hypothetical protein BH11BAC1_BH11BAC1_11290 [soil metagenome]